MTPLVRWLPPMLLGLGAVFVVGIDTQRSMQLERPLDVALPREILGLRGDDITLSEAEVRVAGVTSYLLRSFDQGEAHRFSVYVGYYDRQTQGKTIHSPKNCLPGAGWEPLADRREPIATALGTVTVNRYLLQNGSQQALVLYWYQGRGRVESNEYAVKWDLLRDAALRQRSEEALVRVVVPFSGNESEAFATATGVAQALVPALDDALPG